MKGEFYKMEYEAWDEGTDALTLELEAAYLRLCHQMYRRHGPVPSAPATLSRIWRVHPNKARKLLGDLIAAGKVVEIEGHLANTRVTRELDARETRRTQQADAGHTGGTHTQENRRKALKTNEQNEALASMPVKQNQAEKRREEKNTPIVPKGTLVAEFAEWWGHYPKRRGTNSRAAAEEAYIRVRQSGVPQDVLLAAVKAYAAECRRDDRIGTEFVKQAEFFLSARKRLWDDYAAKAGCRQADQDAEGSAPPAPEAHPYAHWPDDRWRQYVREWKGRGGDWPWKRSPPPDNPNTAVPSHILAEFNIHPARARAA